VLAQGVGDMVGATLADPCISPASSAGKQNGEPSRVGDDGRERDVRLKRRRRGEPVIALLPDPALAADGDHISRDRNERLEERGGVGDGAQTRRMFCSYSVSTRVSSGRSVASIRSYGADAVAQAGVSQHRSLAHETDRASAGQEQQEVEGARQAVGDDHRSVARVQGRLLVLLGKNASWLWLLNHTVFYWSPCEYARGRRLQTQQRAGER